MSVATRPIKIESIHAGKNEPDISRFGFREQLPKPTARRSGSRANLAKRMAYTFYVNLEYVQE